MRDLFKISPPSSFMIVVAYLGLNLATAVAVAVIFFFLPGISPFFLFLPSIILVTWFAGFLPGIFTLMADLIIIAALFFIPMFHSHLTITTSFIIEMGMFVLIGSLISFVIDKAKHQDKIISY